MFRRIAEKPAVEVPGQLCERLTIAFGVSLFFGESAAFKIESTICRANL